MYTRVCGILGLNFNKKNVLRTSRMFLGVRSHGPTGLKMGSLWIGFPVWRELKLTNISADNVRFTLWIGFPVWRELKRLGQVCPPLIIGTLDRLSRLKGIETFADITPVPLSDCLWIGFPVWRELKPAEILLLSIILNLWIGFPVWRELKHQQDDHQVPPLHPTFG